MTTHTAGKNTPEAASYLRKSPRTLIRWRNEGIGPPWIRVGRSILYKQNDLDQWLERHRVEPVRERAEC